MNKLNTTISAKCGLQLDKKYVVKHKSAKLFMTYAVGKLELELVRVS